MKTDLTAIARPYAAAAFAEALSEDNVAAWGDMLDAAARITEERSVEVLLSRPGIEPYRLASFYCEVLEIMLNDEGVRFLELLAEYRRLAALPEIARLFHVRREAFEKKVTVFVVSAIQLDEPHQKKLVATFTKRLERQVVLECSVDPDLVGGIQVRIGDEVLDGSVRGKLTRMIEFISGKLLG